MPSSRPELWFFAGPNGAGKTTFSKRKHFGDLVGVPTPLMLNPDERTRSVLGTWGAEQPWSAPFEIQKKAFIRAAEEIYGEARACIFSGGRVCIETVLSTGKYADLVAEARRASIFVGLIYVALRDPSLSAERVACRVSKGGHPVPIDRIPPRWHRSIEQLGQFASNSDFFVVFDNSDTVTEHAENPPLIARGFRRGDGTLEVVLEAPESIPEISAVLRPLL